jgi:hypothetical protein
MSIMKNLNPVMIFGAIIHFFMLMYGGEESAQKTPLGFMMFFCGGMLLSLGCTGVFITALTY